MPAALSTSPFENFSSLVTAPGSSSKHSASARRPSHRRRREKTRHGHGRAFRDALYHERRLLYRLYGNPRRENHRPHHRRTGRNPPHYFRRTLQKPNPARIRPLFLRRNQPPQTGRRGRHHLRLHRNLPDCE